MHALAGFGEATRRWFAQTFDEPSAVQKAGWPRLLAGEHALLLAPTGSGKTLAAFLASIDSLLHRPLRDESEAGPRVLYISPIKALAYDIERNLKVPLAGIAKASRSPLPSLQIEVRTGDTSARDRRRQLRSPGDILITTPESLYLLLGSQARESLRQVETVIVDEIHAVASNKRGVHLSLSLERLEALRGQPVQRVGLSATQRPLERIAGFLGGDRDVAIVDCSSPPKLDLQIVMPVADMDKAQEPTPGGDDSEKSSTGLWPLIIPRLLQLVQESTTTLLFCNSRRLAERLAQELNELAGKELCKAHHGSVARHQRKAIEGELGRGELRALVATSSLELGIDMSTVDLVVQIESPGSVARGLQRIGRAGHAVGIRSRGVIVPKFKGDLLEATVIGKCMLEGAVEESQVPGNCLDVLAQQIVAMCSVQDWPRRELLVLIRRSFCYQELSEAVFSSVLDMLSGHYPAGELQDLRPRISWDRQDDVLQGRQGSKMISLINGGTIPDRGLFAVHLGPAGPRIGELDEEMVYEARAGETFFLGASTWRILDVTRDKVIVAPAPGETGKMPFWRGESPARPVALGRALGAFCRSFPSGNSHEDTELLSREYRLAPDASVNLLSYLREQVQATGCVPSDRSLVVERFCDEVGDWRLCILSPFGSRVHAPWAMAISTLLAQRGMSTAQILWTDDGIALHMPDTGRSPDTSELLPKASEVQELVLEELANSALFATHFRENAARALLLPKQRPGKRTPLWLQRLKSQQLLSVARRFPSFPIVVETYRECMQDVFDMPALIEILQAIEQGEIRVESVETDAPSPFARGLVFSYVAAFLYEGDAPAAERRAQVLSLDRALLRELLGTENLREFLSLEAIELLEGELQCLAEDRRARDADEVHDMLRRLGALSLAELGRRCTEPPGPWLDELQARGQACRIEIAGREHIIATEDAGRYRDALGVELPADVPVALLAPVPDALEQLVLRYAARHGPFVVRDLAQHLALSDARARAVLQELQTRGRLQSGAMTPGREGLEWCHEEVLRRIRRRSLELLRGQIAPVEAARYAGFLCEHQGITRPGRGLPALREAIVRLGALPLPWSELEARILPARVADYRPDMLDSLCASGEVLWVGAGSLGNRDGKVRLILRRHARSLLQAPEALPPEAPALARRLDEELQSKGASFLIALDLQDDGDGSQDLDEAITYLIWQGRITNDTLAFLRGMKTRPRARKAILRRRMQRRAGRWSSTLGVVGQADATQAVHARAQALLDCFAVVSRDLGPVIGGGYGDIARLLRLMEEQGKLRRGHFVAGLQGSQYARTGVVDRLRECPVPEGQLLAACDPANPWGAALPWPRGIGSRRAGATLLCWGGEPVCFLESGRSKLFTYRRDELLDKVIADLMPRLAAKRTLRIAAIDGESAGSSVLAPRFEAHEFRREQSAMVLETYR